MSEPILAEELVGHEESDALVVGDQDEVVVVAGDGDTSVITTLPENPDDLDVPETLSLVTIDIGGQGPRGPEGPKGDIGGYYMHEQMTPASEWVIEHNLGFRPSVTVQDSAGTNVFGRITYVGDNALVLTFSAAFSGHAYLS